MKREELLNVAKPILFNTEMVKAILDGKKTVTRRLIKTPCQVHECTDGIMVTRPLKTKTEYCRLNPAKPPFQPGDILYIRETWCKLHPLKDDMVTPAGEANFYYAADGYNPTPFNSFPDEEGYCGDRCHPRWHPSIHMPKEAARIFLKVTDVKVGQLKTISPDDIFKEGVDPFGKRLALPSDWITPLKNAYEKLWNSTVDKKDLELYGWNANPWVWVIEFEKIEIEGK